MPTIENQIALERTMVSFGAARYRREVSTAKEAGRECDTGYGQRLLKEFVQPVAQHLQEILDAPKTPGRRSKFKALLRRVECDVSAFIALRALFQHFSIEQGVMSLVLQIGTMIEDECKFRLFHKAHADYFNTIIEDFSKRGTKNYRHMHRVLTMKANEYNVRWSSWTPDEKVAVGGILLDCITATTDLIERKNIRQGKRERAVVYPTQSALDWIRAHTDHAALLRPDRMPCIIPPDPWTAYDSGGYWTPQVRSRTKLVKTRSKAHAQMFLGDISNITTPINILQRVPWAVNTDIHDVMKSFWENNIPVGLPQAEPYIIPACPIPEGKSKADLSPEELDRFEQWKAEARTTHTMEKERVSKCFGILRALKLGEEYSQYDRFWFVYQTDFRGRIYCTVSGLTPQGTDFSKALLRFADGKELGSSGEYWFKVHGANCFGKDKLSYDERVAWVAANTDSICRTAIDPHRHKDWWGNADKPWQFLAWCFEFNRYMQEGKSMVSYLPIGLDGSCNGLQNFSALLRDAVGGQATNLVPSEKPSDIYSEVAAVCTQALQLRDDAEAKLWLLFTTKCGGQLPRGIAKKPVMTLPYGSTQMSCRESIYQYLLEEHPNFFPKEQRWKLAVYLTPILWESIGKVVIAARQAMDWLQDSAVRLAEDNKPVVWWTPVGFPVLQDTKKQEVHRIRTEICGSVRLSLNMDTDEIDSRKQALGVAPNFVHSLDACHLMLTLQLAYAKGVSCFAAIHDDYGTHAADTEKLHKAIREAFLELYNNNEPLLDFKASNETEHGVTLTDPPEKGTLNLGDVLDSKYFFG